MLDLSDHWCSDALQCFNVANFVATMHGTNESWRISRISLLVCDDQTKVLDLPIQGRQDSELPRSFQSGFSFFSVIFLLYIESVKTISTASQAKYEPILEYL